MENWKPILSGEDVLLAGKILTEIEAKVLNDLNEEADINLSKGFAGQLLFLSEYVSDSELLNKHIDTLLDRVSAQTSFESGLMNGLAGVGFVLKIINDKRNILEDLLLKDLYGYVRRMSMSNIRKGYYDYMGGFLGECNFLLEEANNADNLALFELVVKSLGLLSRKQRCGIGWINKIDFWGYFPDAKDLSELPQCCNLGLAHGMPGIIYMLKRLTVSYPQLDTFNLIEDAFGFLTSEESEEDKLLYGTYYKAYGSPFGDTHRGLTLAWCYSDLGISMVYFKIWEITGDKDLFDRAVRIASSCAGKRIEDTPVETGGLCHGAAGIAHLFNKIYHITQQPIFKTASVYWFGILFKKFIIRQSGDTPLRVINKRHTGEYYDVDNGFLEGLAGIGLSLHAAISSSPPGWDRVLLL